jgi:hypothetical protein
MGGLPHDAFDVLARTMARICENPYDRLFSLAVRDEDPRERMAELGHAGFIQFTVDESGDWLILSRTGSCAASALPGPVRPWVAALDILFIKVISF